MFLSSFGKSPGRLVLVVLTVLATASSSGGAQEEPYEINAILGVTGSSSFVGQAQQAALGALAASVNADGGIKGRPVRFAISDNQSNPQLTIQLTNAAIAKKAPLLLVSGLLASCKAIEPMLQTNGPVEFCLSQAIYPAKNSYVFSAGISTHDLLVTELRYFRAGSPASRRTMRPVKMRTNSSARCLACVRTKTSSWPTSSILRRPI